MLRQQLHSGWMFLFTSLKAIYFLKRFIFSHRNSFALVKAFRAQSLQSRTGQCNPNPMLLCRAPTTLQQMETFVHSPTSFKIFEKPVPSMCWSGLCLPNTVGYFLEKKH